MLSIAIATLAGIGCAGDPALAPTADPAPAATTPVCNGGTWGCRAQVHVDDHARIKAASVPSGYGPADLQSAYKLTSLPSPTVTIAIVDAFNYPTAEGDLAVYRSQFDLPPCTKANGCLKIVNQSGATSPLPGNSPAGDDWTIETALDLDMASAACPSCKLLLVEANDDQGNGLFVAQNAAAAAGAVVISNSWGGPSDGLDQSNDMSFFTHTGNVTTFAANGDGGLSGADYPSSSVKVIAVGSTTLKTSTNTRGWVETAFAAGACGTETKPSYQVPVVTTALCSKRTTVDVAAVGDPNTGVAVFNNGAGGFIVIGGTSVSTPLVAAIYARAGIAATTNHDAGYAYAHPCELFDITGTTPGRSTSLSKAGTGWDGPTGVGTPNGAVFGRGVSCLSGSSPEQ